MLKSVNVAFITKVKKMQGIKRLTNSYTNNSHCQMTKAAEEIVF